MMLPEAKEMSPSKILPITNACAGLAMLAMSEQTTAITRMGVFALDVKKKSDRHDGVGNCVFVDDSL